MRAHPSRGTLPGASGSHFDPMLRPTCLIGPLATLGDQTLETHACGGPNELLSASPHHARSNPACVAPGGRRSSGSGAARADQMRDQVRAIRRQAGNVQQSRRKEQRLHWVQCATRAELSCLAGLRSIRLALPLPPSGLGIAPRPRFFRAPIFLCRII